MATAFTEQERHIIHDKLKTAARHYAASVGMRKTTVDQLAEEAGISKGAFYKFYDTKELLFFEVLEEMHTEIYGYAESVLTSRTDLEPADRAAQAFLGAFHLMEEASMMHFWENDLQLLLRKVPEGVLRKHYHSDEEHIRQLIHRSGLHISAPEELVAATIRGLMLTLAHRREIGELYWPVLECLVRGACRQLFIK